MLTTSATIQKQQDLMVFIERKLVPDPAVQAVIGIGSIASGLARSDSDIDAIIFLDPFDWYIIPAEFKWCPDDDSFRSIFSQSSGSEKWVQFDFTRFDLTQWANSSFEWPEERCAELHEGWLLGQERIVTCVSGAFQWQHADEPACFLFDLHGREIPHTFQPTRTDNTWQVDVGLSDWSEIAVIEHAR